MMRQLLIVGLVRSTQYTLKKALAVSIFAVAVGAAFSQDLAPRAYTIAPVHSNAITIAGAHATGSILLDAVLPIPDSSGDSWASSVTYYHSMNFFGRYSNATVTLPYAVSDVQGTLNGIETTSHLSGLLGVDLRFSVNLLGGPAMDLAHFRKWKQKTVLGTSVVVIAPTGQYDPTKLINLGSNRWSFRPELGYSRRLANWVFDLYGGAWLFTTNHDYFSRNQYLPGTNTQTQNPMGSFQGHISYDINPRIPRLWASLDGNFWFGGKTSLNGVENPDTQAANSCIGFSFSVPVPKTRRQSLKFNYGNGVLTEFGPDSRNVAVAWQYSWIGRPQ
jgi:hypothetical protein